MLLLRGRMKIVASIADFPQIEQPSGCMNRHERSDLALMISADDPMLMVACSFLSEILNQIHFDIHLRMDFFILTFKNWRRFLIKQSDALVS